MNTITLNVNTLLLIVAIVAIAFAVLTVLLPFLKKKGVNVGGVLTATSTGINAADLVVDSLQGLFPGSPALLIVDKVIDWARKGAEAAEQLYHIDGIAATERKAEATKFVYDALDVAEIEITPTIAKIVDGCIEAAVFAMGHTAAKGESVRNEGYAKQPAQ